MHELPSSTSEIVCERPLSPDFTGTMDVSKGSSGFTQELTEGGVSNGHIIDTRTKPSCASGFLQASSRNT